MRAEVSGLVIMARETKPTKNLAERVVRALAALYIKRPTAKLYDAAYLEAKKAISTKNND